MHLRLIETTDLHLHLLPWDYYNDRPSPGTGLASAAALIEAARAEVPNALLFDNGDFLQGTPMGDLVARGGAMAGGEAHPVIAAMNLLGYDAISLGNHEFNYGLDFLTRTLADATCPVLSANLALARGAGPRDDRHLVRPYALLDRTVTDANGQPHSLRIGVIGLAPPQVVNWDRHLLDGQIHARDIVDTARAFIPEMREAGADIVLALAHTGIGAIRHSDGMENAALPLARVPGLDALMTGHNHLLFPAPAFTGMADLDPLAGTIAGVPAVMGGCFGAHIGLIDMMLVREGGRWTVLGARSQIRAVPKDTGPQDAQMHDSDPGSPDQQVTPKAPPLPAARTIEDASATPPPAAARIAAAVARSHQATLTAVRQPIGTTRQALHSYFVHLGATEALSLVARAKAAHVATRLAERAAGHDAAGKPLPVLAAVAPFKCGGLAGPRGYTDIPPGPLALRNVADLYPFPNAIVALRLTGAQVLDWLERAASAFNRITPGTTGTLLRNPGAAGYHFEVIEPLEVLYDLTRPARYDVAGRLADPGARRVVWALHEGRPIEPAAEFILCTNSYRLGGAGGYALPGTAQVVLVGKEMIRDLLRDYIAAAGPVTATPQGAMRFAPIPGTAALFETGPGAMAHLDEIAAFAPEPRGMSRAGFLRLKIDLSDTGG